MRKFVAVILLIACGSLGIAADWPTFQNNNARVATSDETLKAPLMLRWVYSAPALPTPAWEGPRQHAHRRDVNAASGEV